MATSKPKIVPRHKMVAFYGVATGDSGTTFLRLKKFTQFSINKNPKEYNRQYVDEEFGVNDIMGYDTSISYAFDKHKNLPVQEDIVLITDYEKTGDDAVRPILLVDLETGDAFKRDFAVVPGTEGDSLSAYTYSGTFKCKGELIHGTADSTDDWQTCTFTESKGEPVALSAGTAVKVTTAKK